MRLKRRLARAWRRRRWWQHAIRFLAWGLLVGAGLYVTLPWWAPTDLIRSHVEQTLSRQAGVDVTIQDLSLSWDEIRVEGLSIASHPGDNAPPVVVAEYVRLPMEPLNILLGRDVEWMEIDGLTLSARVQPGGSHNLGPLTNLNLASQPRRVSVRDAMINVRLPRRNKPLQLNVTDLQFVAGHQRRLGELTLSARLVQEGQPDAPISFRLTRGAGDPSTIAAATFLFDDVDLGDLALVDMLQLPLTRLEGHMQGRLEFRMNPQAVVDRAAMELSIRRLDAQPAGGPQLEVIDQAGVEIDASWDPLGERIRLRTITLELPGSIRVNGRAELTTAHPEPWEAVELLELTGMVNPSRLAALLTGEPQLLDGYRADGPIEWRLRVKHRNRIMLVEEFAFDARPVRLTHRQRVLKRAGEPLAFTTSAALDDRTWRATLTDLRGRWSGVALEGSAAWNDVRTLRTLPDAHTLPAMAHHLLAHLTCDATVRVDHLDGLASLGPAARDLVAAGTLTGSLTGRAKLDGGDSPNLRISLQADESTDLAVRGCFRKPLGAKLTASLEANISADPNTGTLALGDLAASLGVGDGAATIRAGSLLWPAISGRATLRAVGVQTLLTCRPGEPNAAPVLTGALSGEVTFANLLDPDSRSARLDATLTDTAIRAQPWFTKPADERLTLRAELDAATAQLWLTGEAFTANAWTTASPADPLADPNAAFGGELAVIDANALIARSPLLSDRLAGWSVRGPLELSGTLRRSDGRTQLELAGDATGAQLRQGRPPGRAKQADVPLRLSLALEDRPTGPTRRELVISRLSAAAGGLTLLASGEATYDPRATQPAGVRWPIAALEKMDANVMLAGRPTGLAELLPELSSALSEVAMTDDASLAGRVSLGPDGASLRGTLDAGDGRVRIGPLVKPASLRARASLEVRGSATLSEWTLSELLIDVLDPNGPGEEVILARLLADAAVQGQLRRDGLPEPESFRPVSWHAWLASDHLGRVTDVYPEVTGRLLDGSIRLEAENRSGRWGRIDVATLWGEDIRAIHRGREVTFSGELTASRLGWSPRGGWSVASLTATDLEARAGENHAWVIAELTDLPHRPAGRVRLLADTLDDADLADWLGMPGPRDPNAIELSADEVKRLRTAAEKLIKRLGKPLRQMNVALAADVETLRTTDVSVNQTYDMMQLRADVRAEGGELTAKIAAILNGGSYRVSVDADANDPSQPVAMTFDLLKVIGTPEIQPQLAKYFPGNTVGGLFTRSEKLQESLSDSIAYFLDHRYPWTPVGSAKTIATDGYIVGRAVPEWMAGIFPQLNLQRYEYDTMTGFATFFADGVAQNDMIFSGAQYDVYMEGTTDAENRAEYTVGLLVVGGSAEWNHAWKTGRLPLLKVRGTIYGGELLDREVSFLWPNETIMAVAVRNNPVVRAFINRQKDKRPNQP
jgi:hypothetical protein